MKGADKIICQAAAVLLLFAISSTPASAQFGLGGAGGGGGEDMMTQMAPMLNMMKAKLGKRRFAMMMQTMGPMMGQMMGGDGGGGGFGGMMGGTGGMGGMIPGGMGGGNMMGGMGGVDMQSMMGMIGPMMSMVNLGGGFGGLGGHGHRHRRHKLTLRPNLIRQPVRHSRTTDSAGLTGTRAARFGPQRVRTTLAQDSVPNITIDDAASTKKFCAVAPFADSHQPPSAMKINRAVCANTGPAIFAAPCDEKYIELASPIKA
jgi:hypothetical protein